MNILIIGATGNAGSRIVAEAVGRGHQVTAASRHPHDRADDHASVTTLRLDATIADQVFRAAQDHDVIVGACRPAAGREADVMATTRGLAGGAQRAGRRLLAVGGAAVLFVPGTGRRALDDTDWVPAGVRGSAAASADQLSVLQGAPSTDWTYMAPAASFEPGQRTGTYRTAGHDLVISSTGQSFISMEDYAIALLDEVERPTTCRAVLSTGT